MARATDAVLEHPEGLVRVLSSLPVSANPPRDPSAWKRAPALLKIPLLVELLPTDPARWAPMLVAALARTEPKRRPRRWITELSAVAHLQLQDAYQTLVYTCESYRRRVVRGLGSVELANGPVALWDALGGEPDRSEPDVRWSLQDRLWHEADVQRIARGLEEMAEPVVPVLQEALLPLAPERVAGTVQQLRSFFAAACERRLRVDVKWSASPGTVKPK